MKQLPTTTQPTFDLPDYTPGALDYMAQAHTDEMFAFVHLFRQQCSLFGLPFTYSLKYFLPEAATTRQDRQQAT